LRKQAQTLDEARDKLRKQYRGSRVTKTQIKIDEATEVELAVLKTKASFLKAAGYSHTYIADALGTTRSIVGHWFEDPQLRAETMELTNDIVGGALKLLKTYGLELIEMEMEIARQSDDKTALSAIQDMLDRIGLTKINKSEGVTRVEQHETVSISDPAGLIEKLRDAPPEVQQQAAQHMESMMALMSEHTDADVTHE
jgi:hypothetical protein